MSGRHRLSGGYLLDGRLATCSSQGGTVQQIVIDAFLPVLHEPSIVVFGERCDKGVAFRPETRVGVGDECLRTSCDRAKLYGELAGSDERGDLEHLHETLVGLVSGDIPDRVVWGCSSNEYAVRFSNSRVSDHGDRIPALEPVGLAYRAQQRKDYRWLGDEALRIAAGHAGWLGDIHGPRELRKVANDQG